MNGKVFICGVNTSNLPKLSLQESEKLMVKIKQGDLNAKQTFVYANMRLVLSVIQKFLYKKSSCCDDLFQVGCVGLIKAIDNFDNTMGIKFSTYAVPMIVGEIKRFLRDDFPLRVSRSMRDVAYQALQIRQKIEAETQKEAEIEDIAKMMDVPLSQIACALDALSEPMSLDEPIFNDENDSNNLSDHIADSQETQDKWINNVAIKDALKTLSSREQTIILMRYYLGKTQTEVSVQVGISQAQVSRIEKSALKTVKKFLI